jgi:hypothetical protein
LSLACTSKRFESCITSAGRSSYPLTGRLNFRRTR